jgi:ferredoxin
MSTAVVACKAEAFAPDGVTTVPGLCEHPASIGEAVGEADSLVLLVHREDVELSQLQAAIRKSGFDPFGVPLIDIAGTAGDPVRLGAIIAGASARASAFGGSQPEHARPVMSGTMSRRSLLTIPRPYYEAVPLIDGAICAAGDGCKACTELCPAQAFRIVGRRVAFDKDACVACGRCLTGCPTGAIASPAMSAVAIRAEIEAIVAATSRAGIVFTCERSKEPVNTTDWYQVVVPCSGMVPGTWPVAALLLGAGASTIQSCGDAGCPLGSDEISLAALAFARSLLGAAGLDEASIPQNLGPVPASPFADPTELADPFGVHGAAEVVLGLAATDRPVAVASDAAMLGVVEVDAGSCTLCTMCAETCPTGALDHGYSDGVMELTFDAALCTGCAQCLPMCPELDRGAITLARGADSAVLGAGRLVLNETETVTCQSCGGPIAPAATLARLGALLGDDHADTARYVATRCIDCRGLA